MTSLVAKNRIDIAAAGLSAACLIHCLALPLVAAAAPMIASWSEAEWAHKALVLTAAPISLYAIIERTSARGGRAFAIAAASGLSLLAAGAFVEPLHAYERILTAIGGLTLGGAHIAWWRRHQFK
ncbi:MAG: MerC domain-containing protein [Pseudomonadota bacterium]